MQTQAPNPPCDGGKRKVLRRVRRRGFALIVVLTLMMLLAVLALGFLGLSSISLRSSGADEAQYQARANARLALMLAIGDLQKLAGTDKAITAPSELVSANPGKPNLTGVWQSWNYDTNGSAAPNYTTEKNNRFLGWLVSDSGTNSVNSPNYAGSGYIGDTIELVGEGTLGKNVSAAQKVTAGRVTVTKGNKVDGAFAWHISDESVKARIGNYRDPSLNGTLAKKRALLSGNRADLSLIRSPDGTSLNFLPTDENQIAYKKSTSDAAKLVNLAQTDILAPTKQTAGKFRNIVTPYSMGLLTDARNGGLKKDLTSMFEATALPADYNGKKLYQSTRTLTANVASDPNWSALYEYYNIYTRLTKNDVSPTFSQSAKNAVTLPINGATPVAPTGFNPTPVIAKLDIMFSMVLREAHANWANDIPNANPKDPERKYLVHLLYTPMITLYNPYNVTIEFEKMQVVIKNPPVGFNFSINGQKQNTQLVPIGNLYNSNVGQKNFAFDIANWSSTSGSGTSGPVSLKPGQTLLCSAFMDPTWKFDGNNSTNTFFDWENKGNLGGNTNNNAIVAAKAKPGFSGKSVGFDLDYLTPSSYKAATTDDSAGVLGIRKTATIAAEFGVIRPTGGVNTEFQVSTSVTAVGGSTVQSGGLVFKYDDQATLTKHFPTVYRYPLTGEIVAETMLAPNSLAIGGQNMVKALGLFSAYARTSNGGVYETNKRTPTANSLNALADGRIAGKPFLFANPGSTVEVIDLKKELPGNYAHELNFSPFKNGEILDSFEVDLTNRTPILTANSTAAKGIKAGAQFELPSGPMQAISDFRRSNALTTPFPPSFVQPVANSTVSPLMSTTGINQAVTGGGTPLLDQSYLANHSLYDQFYFSSIAADGTTDAGKAFEGFLNGSRRLANQSFEPWLPKDESVSGTASKYFAGGKPTNDAYLNMARLQMVRGPFNVNSVNVEVWKAQLAAMSKSEVATLWAKTAVLESQKSSEIPILAMTLPTAGSTKKPYNGANADTQLAADWAGYRELTEAEVTTLAEKIVAEVRARGPFLSLSEFVNRRIGPDSELTRTGALQAAIANATLNKVMDNATAGKAIPLELTDFNNGLLYNYKTPQVLVGNPMEGAPSWISQGDLMRVLEPSITVRGDTFVIRTCGQSVDGNGKITARAYAEAVVQRVPEYVDPKDAPSVNVFQTGTTSTSAANKRFGRRFEVVSFRWLSNFEI